MTGSLNDYYPIFRTFWIIEFYGRFNKKMGKPGTKSGKAEASESVQAPKEKKEKKGPMHLSKGAKKAKNVKANHGGKTDRKPL